MKTDEQTLREALEEIRDYQKRSVFDAQDMGVIAMEALQATNPQPEYETPEEYESRKGKEPDDSASAWGWYNGRWEHTTYMAAAYEHKVRGIPLVLPEKGKGAPPEDWRPE